MTATDRMAFLAEAGRIVASDANDADAEFILLVGNMLAAEAPKTDTQTVCVLAAHCAKRHGRRVRWEDFLQAALHEHVTAQIERLNGATVN